MKPFPLVPWLEAHGLYASDFAKANGLSFRAVYGYCNGERWHTGNLRVLLAIEAGTNGEVSLREMVNWIEAKRAEMEADALHAEPAVPAVTE